MSCLPSRGSAWRSLVLASGIAASLWLSAGPAAADHCPAGETHDGTGGCVLITGDTTTTTTAPLPEGVDPACAWEQGGRVEAEPAPCPKAVGMVLGDTNTTTALVMVGGAVLGLSLARFLNPSEGWLR